MLILILLFLIILNAYAIKHTVIYNKTDNKLSNHQTLKDIFGICFIIFCIVGISTDIISNIILQIFLFVAWIMVMVNCSFCCKHEICSTCPCIMLKNKNIFDKIIIYCIKKANIAYHKLNN